MGKDAFMLGDSHKSHKIEMPNRELYLDIARGIAILFVVMFHVTSNHLIASWFEIFQLYIFFFVSGCLFRNCKLKTFLFKKVKNILVPYFAWGGITLAYYLLIEQRFRNLPLKFVDCLFGLFTGIEAQLDFNSPLWFVSCFLMVSMVYLLLYKTIYGIFKVWKGRLCWTYLLLFFVIACWCVAFNLFDVKWRLFSIYKVPKFLMAYLIGNVFETYILKHVKKLKNWQLIFIGIILIAISGLLHHALDIKILTIISAVCATISLSIGIGKQKLLETIGKESFTIMCIHGPIYRVIVFFAGKILNSDTEAVRSYVLLSILISVITVLVCLLVKQCITIVDQIISKRIVGFN